MDKAINIIDDTVNSYFVSIQRLEGSVHRWGGLGSRIVVRGGWRWTGLLRWDGTWTEVVDLGVGWHLVLLQTRVLEDCIEERLMLPRKSWSYTLLSHHCGKSSVREECENLQRWCHCLSCRSRWNESDWIFVKVSVSQSLRWAAIISCLLCRELSVDIVLRQTRHSSSLSTSWYLVLRSPVYGLHTVVLGILVCVESLNPVQMSVVADAQWWSQIAGQLQAQRTLRRLGIGGAIRTIQVVQLDCKLTLVFITM